MRRTAIHLAAQQVMRLRVLSNGSGLSVAELIRRAIDEFADRQALKQGDAMQGPGKSQGE
ncbi:hypothetical protein BN2475_40100 [Paraburkholderia ribeironis]|uniref:Ribbon-helix-helix protein CopG domain-containing protein n=1 Tax=Paraburkholderia ribeironis TaxID=1247936 RepID=A0A1N7RJL3_9BURK|nr:ribbon-helix-helix protein, CopG family [Paraburkholderia ribeironis]SIT35293.1 hypothetical protein BN2475_40100 [Paraburkholderia ribeironis]